MRTLVHLCLVSLLLALFLWQSVAFIAARSPGPVAGDSKPVSRENRSESPVAEMPVAEQPLAAQAVETIARKDANITLLLRQVGTLSGTIQDIRAGRLSLLAPINYELMMAQDKSLADFLSVGQTERLAQRLAEKEQSPGYNPLTDPDAALIVARQELLDLSHQYREFVSKDEIKARDPALLSKLLELQMTRRDVLDLVARGFGRDDAAEVYRQGTEATWRNIEASLGAEDAAALRVFTASLPARQEFAGALRTISGIGHPPPAEAMRILQSAWIESGAISALNVDRYVFGEGAPRSMTTEKVEQLLESAQTMLAPNQYEAVVRYVRSLQQADVGATKPRS